jgi:hypothetical protein
MLDYDIDGEPLYITDPSSCLDDPERPGRKLCPRCSKPDDPCCNIIPLGSLILFEQLEVSERKADEAFPTEEDYRNLKWRCGGGCDRNGKHGNSI